MASESDSEYKDGKDSHGMKGVVIPSAIKGDRESSGVRFDVHNPFMSHNIITIGEDGRETQYRMTAEEYARMREDRSMGKSAGFDEVISKGGAPVKETKMSLLQPIKTAVQDDSVPTTEESVRLPSGPVLKAISPRHEGNARADQPPPSHPEKTAQPAVNKLPPLSPQTEGRSLRELEANQEVREIPRDLDLEPDPSPGPERISSYEVAAGEEAPSVLQPAMTPGGAEEEALERDAGNEDLGEMPEVSVHAPDSILRKGQPIGALSANLKSAPMQVQRVKVRFISPLGKLAVPYNQVFRYGVGLWMIQYSEEGMFYDPPQVVDQAIEVWWHGRVFICFPGVYGEFPDRKMAITVFFIDEEKTRARRKALQSEAGK